MEVLHHDVLPLPNGHWIVLTNTLQQFTDLPGYPGVTNVLGDVLVDLDTNLNPVWVWNEFNHLDVNRHPLLLPDWTHTNAVIYSGDDGNLIVSIRHQNWLVKWITEMARAPEIFFGTSAIKEISLLRVAQIRRIGFTHSMALLLSRRERQVDSH